MNDQWSSKWGFIWGVAGSAIGLGNIWRFPYLAGKYGGGAFLLLYLLSLLVLGLPMLAGELALGRHTRQNPADAIKSINPGSKRGKSIAAALVLAAAVVVLFYTPGWGILLFVLSWAIYRFGWETLAFSYIIGGIVFLGVYATTSGCTLTYLWRAASGMLPTASNSAGSFWTFLSHPGYALLSLSIYLVICATIVWCGLCRGIERFSVAFVPLMIPLLLLLVILALTLPGAGRGVAFFLTPDFNKITMEACLAAFGQAMLSLSLGLGINIAYGGYLVKHISLPTATLMIAGLDTLVSILAGLLIFPAAFAAGIAPDNGPGLVFETIPVLIQQFGSLWRYPCEIAFFLMLAIAAVSSGLGTFEVAVSFLTSRFPVSRPAAVSASAAAAMLFGGACAYGGLDWHKFPGLEKLLQTWFGSANGSLFLFLDHFGGSIFLPVGGLLIVVFMGWAWGSLNTAREILASSATTRRVRALAFVFRYVLPLLLMLLFIHALRQT